MSTATSPKRVAAPPPEKPWVLVHSSGFWFRVWGLKNSKFRALGFSVLEFRV